MKALNQAEVRAPGGMGPLPGKRVVAFANSKGGVGKTTLAHNLAVFARSVDASQPVLIVGLDDSPELDEMFALDGAAPNENIYTALRRGSLDSAIRPGRYGVYYVPSSPRITEPIRQQVDPHLLHRILGRSAFSGLVLIDTKSDLGTLTQNAIAASDLCVVPVADLASLGTAERIFTLLDAWGLQRSRARVVLSMLDLRIKYRAELCRDMLGLLVACARQLDLPLFQSFIARSPRVQALATNPKGRIYSVVHEGIRTSAHRQMGELAEEMLEAIEHPRATGTDQAADRWLGSSPEERDEPVAWLRPRTAAASFAVPQDGQEPLCIRRFPFFVGRHDPVVLNDLAVEDLQPWQVSRRHAHFIQRDGRVGVMDLGSTMGTWVNGHQLGGPTADPGPVFFGPRGGELVLGNKRRSQYVFGVEVSKEAAHPSKRATSEPPPLRSAALAALVS